MADDPLADDEARAAAGREETAAVRDEAAGALTAAAVAETEDGGVARVAGSADTVDAKLLDDDIGL